MSTSTRSPSTLQMAQHEAALLRGNTKRLDRAELRRRVAAGEITLEQLIAEPPEVIHGMLLLDVIRKYRTGARNAQRSSEWVTRLGRRAVADGVNLCVQVDRASERTRVWTLEYCRFYSPRRGRPRRDASITLT